jgi:hypothetical protein
MFNNKSKTMDLSHGIQSAKIGILAQATAYVFLRS